MTRPLVNQEIGEIDHLAVVERADLRAYREWGGPNPPPSYFRDAHSWMIERSRLERYDWRRSRGLPSDDPTTLMSVPSWGASGDSFGRGR